MNRDERDEMDRQNKTRDLQPVDRAEFERLEGLVRELDQRIQAGAIRPQLDKLSKRVGELEGALQPDQPQPDSDGWIPWHGGGSCPVAGETMVDVRFRNYVEKMDRLASVFRWNHAGSATDIIAYRPAKQEAEWPQDGSDYYFFNAYGTVRHGIWRDRDAMHRNRRDSPWGIYPTRAQAEEAAEKIKRVMDHLRKGEGHEVRLIEDSRDGWIVCKEVIEL